jgi:hypothetical protein
MIEWAFILTPLLVLPVLVLFRFVGCAAIANLGEGAPDPPKVPQYRDYIMGKSNNPGSVKHNNVQPKLADVIAYWRLVDLPISDTVAIDEKGFQNGKYRISADPRTTPGNFVTGQTSLIDSDPKVMGRFFNGGYVLVPGINDPYTDDFTIEAWVLPSFTSGAEHTLFAAGGHYVKRFESTAGDHGFRILATTERRWQVNLAPIGDIFPTAPPLIPPGETRTHLAVTVQSLGGGSTRVAIFIDGKLAKQATVGFYSRPDRDAPLLIGVGSQQADPRDLATLPEPNLDTPIRSRLQEVVLHRKVLSQEEIENHVFINQKE